MNDQQTSPAVSVVIPFYSNAAWLCEAVDSVFAQDYDNYEIIVVNDGSPEDVTAFLKSYGEKIKYVKKENGGPASARNEGIRLAGGEYIAFLDSDDLWNPQKLSVQIEKMQAYQALWSYTDYEAFSDSAPGSLKRMHANGGEGFYRRFSPYIGTPAVMVSKKLLTDHGLFFDEDFRFGQDALLWERLNSISMPLYIPESLVKVRIRGNNAGRRAAVQIYTRVNIYDRCRECIDGYRKNCTLLYRFAMALCRFGRLFVNKNKLADPATERIARVMFALPYLLFKTERKLFASDNRCVSSEPRRTTE